MAKNIGKLIRKVGKGAKAAYMYVPKKIGGVAGKAAAKVTTKIGNRIINAKATKLINQKFPVNVGMSVGDFQKAKKAATITKQAVTGRARRKLKKTSKKIGDVVTKTATATTAISPAVGITVWASEKE